MFKAAKNKCHPGPPQETFDFKKSPVAQFFERSRKPMHSEWIQAFGKMTYGIYVLTTAYEDQINGMIASWVSQISYYPPMLMVAIHPHRYSNKMMEKSGCMALHVLSKDQRELVSRFKGPVPADKFLSLQWTPGATGCPILKDCIAYLECEIKDKLNPGNHTLFLGEVVAAEFQHAADPLTTMDYDGVYLGKT
jgi:flavin reductase (DIM6/NTAB) family NADH-FMN oxidoreductase RutF